jgi:hypothetical protein
MPDSVRGFDIERSENNVDLQEKNLVSTICKLRPMRP